MKALVVYDSTYGNTERIAQAIGEAIGGLVLQVDGVKPADLRAFDVVIVGSPTHNGLPTKGVQNLLKASLRLEGVSGAAFDTRTSQTIFGCAAPRIARSLERNGGQLLAPAEGFLVQGVHGPLLEGELERAASWAKGITAG